jgi:hypothetical protein
VHERLKLIDAKEVHIEIYPGNVLFNRVLPDGKLKCGWSACGNVVHQETDDRLGIEAGHLADACFLETGDFAALSDESPVPFTGKLLRCSLHPGPVLAFAKHPDIKDFWYVRISDSKVDGMGSRAFLPLTPPPKKVTPWSAEVAFTKMPPNTHLIHKLSGKEMVVRRFESWSGGWHVFTDTSYFGAYELARDFTLTDGSPCGEQK